MAPGDILRVRDGIYPIGTAVFVTRDDVPMLFQSHIFRIRVLKSDAIDPYLLFVCLNTPVVKAQVRSKQFTQDIIDTLGNRVLESSRAAQRKSSSVALNIERRRGSFPPNFKESFGRDRGRCRGLRESSNRPSGR